MVFYEEYISPPSEETCEICKRSNGKCHFVCRDAVMYDKNLTFFERVGALISFYDGEDTGACTLAVPWGVYDLLSEELVEKFHPVEERWS